MHEGAAFLSEVPPSLADEARLQARLAELQDRPTNTSLAYGSMHGDGSGPSKEFKCWCEAGPGVVVYGHPTGPSKVPTDVTVTPDKKNAYIVLHLSKRPVHTTTGKPIPGTKVSAAVVAKHVKMLSDLYKQQCVDDPEKMKDIPPPKTMCVAGIKKACAAAACTARHVTYQDPGLNHAGGLFGCNSDQKRQILEACIHDDAYSPRQYTDLVGPALHAEIAFGDSMVLHNDSCHGSRLTTPFIYGSPVTEGPGGPCPLLILSADYGKTN
jgi:hypothetical protein